MPKVTDRARGLRNNPTDAEKALWKRLQHEQLGLKFRRQHPIDPYIVDFYCPDKKLIIEVDGGQHNENKQDEARTAYLESKGYRVIRFWNNEVLQNTDGVLETIMNELSLPPDAPPPASGRGGKGGREPSFTSGWRKDFPVLQTKMHGKRLAFLDSAASAQKPQIVIDTMRDIMEGGYANIHRGLYEISLALTERFENTRAKAAKFIGAEEREIIFVRNTTEGINLVAQSWARTHLNEGDEIIISEMEHHANIVPWQLLRDQIGIDIKVIPVDDQGVLDLEAFEKLLTPQTKLVAVTHISNALGTVNPVRQITAIAKDFYPEMKVLVDGSQGVVHSAVDVKKIGCDFYVFTGHKLYGPTGAGVLYGRYDVLESMPPYQGGGDMIERVTFRETTYKEPPFRFEAGTPAIVEVIGLGAAIDYVQGIGVEAIEDHESKLLAYATEKMLEIDGLTIYGSAPGKAGIISFTVEGIHPSDIGMVLDQCGVAVRAGHHCCMPLMQRYGLDATVRASFGLYSDKEDIDQLIAGLGKVKELFA